MVGKSDIERKAAASMMQILERSEAMTPDQAKNVACQGAKDEKTKNKVRERLAVCDLRFEHGGQGEADRERDVGVASGCKAWVRLRERFSKGTEATSYAEISSSSGLRTVCSRISGESGARRCLEFRWALCRMRQRSLWR